MVFSGFQSKLHKTVIFLYIAPVIFFIKWFSRGDVNSVVFSGFTRCASLLNTLSLWCHMCRKRENTENHCFDSFVSNLRKVVGKFARFDTSLRQNSGYLTLIRPLSLGELSKQWFYHKIKTKTRISLSHMD